MRMTWRNALLAMLVVSNLVLLYALTSEKEPTICEIATHEIDEKGSGHSEDRGTSPVTLPGAGSAGAGSAGRSVNGSTAVALPPPPPVVKESPLSKEEVSAYVAKTWPSLRSKSVVMKQPAGWKGVVLSSFPRSGSHWLRTVMELYYEQPMLVRTFITKSTSPPLMVHTHDPGSWPATLHLFREPVSVAFSECEYRHGKNPKNFCLEDCLDDAVQRHARHGIAMMGKGPRDGQLDVDHASLTGDFCTALEHIDGFLQAQAKKATVPLAKMKGVPFDRERCRMAQAHVTKDLLATLVTDPEAIPQGSKESYENRRQRTNALFGDRIRRLYVDEWRAHGEKLGKSLEQLAKEVPMVGQMLNIIAATQNDLIKVPPTPLEPLSGCKAEGRRIFDATLFGNEFEIVEARIYEYHEVVDGWIFLDHDVTFTGKKRAQGLRAFLEDRVPQFMDRIIFAEGPSRQVCPEGKARSRSQAFSCEFACRNALLKAVPGGLGDNDYLLISDTDEVVDRQYLRLLRGCDVPDVISYNLVTYHHSLHWQAWKRPFNARACNGKYFKKPGASVENCYRCRQTGCPRIRPKGIDGWHMSYFGGGRFVRNKLGMYAETQTNRAPWNTMDHIMSHAWSGHELLDRPIFDLRYIPDDQLIGPWFVLANKDQRKMFLDFSKEDRPHAWRG